MMVMKFGGTSLGNAERIRDAVALIESRLKEKPIVVVSAVGGITDLLLKGGASAAAGSFPSAALKKITERHDRILGSLGLPGDDLTFLYGELANVYRQIASHGKFEKSAWDHAASFGERFSSRIMASMLRKNGKKARAFDAWEIGFITNSDWTHAKLLPESASQIKKKLVRFHGVPVITGFIGKDLQGNITTLGRGGSDLSASLIGAAVGAKSIEIWTDVPGVMSADPRLVPKAATIPTVSFEEAAELAAFGAKVLHPKTLEPAVKKNIPVLVKNTFHPSAAGTRIIRNSKKGSGLKAITVKKGITSLNLYSTGMLEAHGFLAKVFGVLEKHGISVDVVTTSEVNVSLTLDNTEGLAAAVGDLRNTAEVSVAKDRAIVAIVGEGLKETPGVAGAVFQILRKARINVEMISQGASQINLTFVVHAADALKAVKLLHREFFV